MEAIRNPDDDAILEMRLISLTYAADNIHLFEFRPVRRKTLPTYEPGAHIDVYLPNELVRQYSLVNPCGDGSRYIIGVKRDPRSRGGSRYMFDSLALGSIVKIGSPRNNFHLAKPVAHSILIAGGIGITPIWSMVQELEARQMSWELHYASRTRTEAAFADQLTEFGARVHMHIDEEQNGGVMNVKTVLAAAGTEAHVYCCGPAPMLAAFEEAAKSYNLKNIHVEHFANALPKPDGRSFTVRLARSGKTITVAAGQTILDALRVNGVNVASSCEQGICGACETKVLSGLPDHRDMILSEEEKSSNITMMICCSGSLSEELVLEI